MNSIPVQESMTWLYIWILLASLIAHESMFIIIIMEACMGPMYITITEVWAPN